MSCCRCCGLSRHVIAASLSLAYYDATLQSYQSGQEDHSVVWIVILAETFHSLISWWVEYPGCLLDCKQWSVYRSSFGRHRSEEVTSTVHNNFSVMVHDEVIQHPVVANEDEQSEAE